MTAETTKMPVLYVEDEENDAFLLQLAFERAGVPNAVRVVKDGQEAVDYLSGAGDYGNREKHPLPCLMLLDLNLPRLSGMEVLQWVRGETRFKGLPVVIFTSSDQPLDRTRALEFGANEYIVKPLNMARMKELVRGLDQRWLNLAARAEAEHG
jgi:DNA-binding response OmpR family regulator